MSLLTLEVTFICLRKVFGSGGQVVLFSVVFSTRGESLPLWVQPHPVKSECFSWQRPASVPLTTVVFPLGPFQQDGVGTRCQKTQKQAASWVQSGKLPYILTSTRQLHSRSGPEQRTGRKPAHIPVTEQGGFILTLALSIFRLFLHWGKHLQVTHTLSQGADHFSSKNQHV